MSLRIGYKSIFLPRYDDYLKLSPLMRTVDLPKLKFRGVPKFQWKDCCLERGLESV